jgi:hypothetical protein
MLITKTSQLTKREHTINLNVTQEQMDRFDRRRDNGEHVQTIFPHLSAEQREFILTGITPEEWDFAFRDLD